MTPVRGGCTVHVSRSGDVAWPIVPRWPGGPSRSRAVTRACHVPSWCTAAAEHLHATIDEVAWDGETFTANGSTAAVTDVLEAEAPGGIVGHGTREELPTDVSIRTFGAVCAEVDVDVVTGAITVLRVVCAPDCGKIVNPQLARSQVIGGVTQGLGYALTERETIDHDLGVVLNANLEDYLVPTIADSCEIVHAEVDDADLAANPLGTKGLGELPMIAVAPAIANAVYDATGLRFHDLPITRCRVLDALASRDGP